MKKMVEVSHIRILLEMIEKLKYKSHVSSWDEFNNIIDFIEERILKVEQEEKNELKKAIYKRMKKTTGEENKKLYKLYHEIDKIFDSSKYESREERKALRMLEFLEKMEEYGIRR